MGIKLQTGVFSACFGLAGAGAVVIWPEQKIIGWGLLGIATTLFLWGIKWRDRHWWGNVPIWLSRHIWWRFGRYNSQLPTVEQIESDKRTDFVNLKIVRNQGYVAELEFAQDVKNVSVTIDVYFDNIMAFVGGDYVWLRFRKYVPIEHKNYNKGWIETIGLIKVKTKGNDDINVDQCVTKRYTSSGILKAIITITAEGCDPLIDERIFIKQEKAIRLVPPELPDKTRGNATDYKEGECVLWIDR